MADVATACYNSYSNRSDFYHNLETEFIEDDEWCESSWNDSQNEQKCLEYYLSQNFNIQSAKYEKQQQVKLPRMVPGTKNFIECDDLDDFHPFYSSLISQNSQTMVS